MARGMRGTMFAVPNATPPRAGGTSEKTGPERTTPRKRAMPGRRRHPSDGGRSDRGRRPRTPRAAPAPERKPPRFFGETPLLPPPPRPTKCEPSVDFGGNRHVRRPRALFSSRVREARERRVASSGTKPSDPPTPPAGTPRGVGPAKGAAARRRARRRR